MTDRHEAECARVEASFTETHVQPSETAIRVECLRIARGYTGNAQALAEFVLAGDDRQVRLDVIHARDFSNPYASWSPDDIRRVTAELYSFATGKAA